MTAWSGHDDPRLAAYDVPPLTPAERDAAWERMHEDPTIRHVAGLVDGVVRAHVVLRRRALATASLGIAMDGAFTGRGYGRRILRDLRGYCRTLEALERLTLEVDAWNERAIRAYRAAGFVTLASDNGILSMEATL